MREVDKADIGMIDLSAAMLPAAGGGGRVFTRIQIAVVDLHLAHAGRDVLT